ncbi:hypothetical protein [Nocardia jejuensis]|uniref:hypothetical protein n=1 Tax=Nocardia jejuensis TaxID=328049 RepID=UPI000AEDF4F2|nr:hypothetical protein [Nocardia jejuensis]
MDAIVVLAGGLFVLIFAILAVTHFLDRTARHRESGTASTVSQIRSRLATEARYAAIPVANRWRQQPWR